ncbi:hypothetical protein [uncultured Jatrophihabitans sp.]|uniref:hypothetical protein n=1 Tax=uncultured Jatrophihabitans sp. TaxID=1610747 RepID=UPI0035CC3656
MDRREFFRDRLAGLGDEGGQPVSDDDERARSFAQPRVGHRDQGGVGEDVTGFVPDAQLHCEIARPVEAVVGEGLDASSGFVDVRRGSCRAADAPFAPLGHAERLIDVDA